MLTLTVQDLPDVVDQLDTIAEHDLQPQFNEDSPTGDAYAEAARLIRKARATLLDALGQLQKAGVEWDED